MTKGNGKIKEPLDRLNLEHELPTGNGQGEESAQPERKQAEAPESAELTEIEKLRSENRAYLDRLARLQAEFDNFRKRNAKEQQDYRDYALAEALKLLLPILDSLDRAVKTEKAGAEDFRSGLELIDRQFHDVLTKLGVEPIASKAAAFDPNLHQAVQMVPSSEVPENHVAEELQRGYKLRDRLLRPAMVVVARKPEK
jgi:molecular chaperone GrpE